MKTKFLPALLAISGVVLTLGITSTASAEFNLNSLKVIVDRARAYQDSMKQRAQQPTSSDKPVDQPTTSRRSDLVNNNNDVILFNDAAQKVAAKYDIAGIKTGMPISEARAILKKKPHLKEYREYGATLVFNTVDGERPLANYIQGIVAQTDFRSRVGDRENLTIALSPEPGHEKVLLVTRSINFAKENRPTPESYKSALIEKYGQPATYDPGSDRLIWFYDYRGNPVPVTNLNTMFQGPGKRCHLPSSQLSNSTILRTGDDDHFRSGIDNEIRTSLRDDDGALYRCGSLMVTAIFNNSYPRGLLEGVTTTIANYSLEAESSLNAGRKLESAEKAYAVSRLQDAAKRKPNL